MYQTQNKEITFISDYDIGELLNLCSELFGTTLKESSVQAFVYLLRQKFNFTTDKQILDACSEYASNPILEHRRFSPSMLSGILIAKQKEKFPNYNNEFFATDEKKRMYKEKYLNDLYSDFDNYCKRIQPSRIFIWNFVCEKLKEKNIISEKEYNGARENNIKRQSRTTSIKEIHNTFRELCMIKFKDMAMQGKHISEYIN